METNSFKLAREIIERSVSDTWETAKKEWKLNYIYFADELDHCLCGHPIIECCVLKNVNTNQLEIVGNVCVNKFMGIESDKIFKGIKKIKKNIEKPTTLEAINYAHEQKWINTWEKDFYIDTMNLKKLTKKQKDKREQVNTKIINNTSKKHGQPT